jgi:nucleoid DNA-binding protein
LCIEKKETPKNVKIGGSKMNKKGLIDAVAEKSGLKKKDAKVAVESVLAGLVEGLVESGKVTLVKFGTFELYERKARKGRNPSTQEPIDIPAKTALKFRVSKNLKEAVQVVDLGALGE